MLQTHQHLVYISRVPHVKHSSTSIIWYDGSVFLSTLEIGLEAPEELKKDVICYFD